MIFIIFFLEKKMVKKMTLLYRDLRVSRSPRKKKMLLTFASNAGKKKYA